MTEAEQVVQRQLDAYNAQDLEAFCACYRADVQIEHGMGGTVLRGMEPFRHRYAALFAAHPSHRARITHRTVLGSWVVDEELIEGRADGPLRAVAVFHVTQGLIDHVRFLHA